MPHTKHTIVSKIIAIVLCILASGNMTYPMEVITAIATWPEEHYHAAYQGAARYYTLGKEEYEWAYKLALTATREQADAENWSEEFRVVCDWIYTLKMTEKEYLSEPFRPWTFNDLKQINCWLTRLTSPHPGMFRENFSKWELRVPNESEKAYLELLVIKYFTQMGVGYKEYQKSLDVAHPWIAGTLSIAEDFFSHLPDSERKTIEEIGKEQYIARPLSEDEKNYLNATLILFPPPIGIPLLLQDALEPINTYMKRLDELGDQRHQVVSNFGAVLHYELVRIHPFEGGHKRLGRICMNIMRMQEGRAPLSIHSAQEYRIALMESIYHHDSDSFVAYMNRCDLLNCSYCKKNADKLFTCSRCKGVRYCGTVCQRADWHAGHKKCCQERK